MDIKIQNCKNNNTIYNTKDWVEYTDEVKKALEKQIPKKPLLKTDHSAYEDYYACPSCAAFVAEYMNYCSGDRDYGEPSERGCGQKLDWGD